MGKSKNQVPAEAVLRHRERQIAELKNSVSRAVRPIISIDALTGFPSPEATCVLIKGSTDRFLLTAAHVLEIGKTLELQVLTKSGFTRLSGTVSTTASVGVDDKCDAAVIALPPDSYPQIEDSEFLSIYDADPDEETAGDQLYTAFGFPVGLAIPSDCRTHINFRPITCTGSGRPSALKHLKLSPETHIAFEFNRLKSFDTGGKRKTVPIPVGMSGGPVFRLDSSGEGNNMLVGIVTEWPVSAHDCLIGAHIGVCLGGMKALVPTLPIGFSS